MYDLYSAHLAENGLICHPFLGVPVLGYLYFSEWYISGVLFLSCSTYIFKLYEHFEDFESFAPLLCLFLSNSDPLKREN